MNEKDRIITETFREENGDIVTHIRYMSTSPAAEKAEMLRKQLEYIKDELEMLEG